MKTSLKTNILNYIKSRYPDFVTGAIIEDFSKGYGYFASNGLRRCRELQNSGLIIAEYYHGVRGERLVKYRYNIPSDEKEKRNFLKETGRLKIEIVTLPSGERIAKEVIVK